MNANHVHDLLNDYVDGELNASDRQRVEAHLASCSECRRDLQELRALLLRIHGLPQIITPPPDVTEGVRNAFAQERAHNAAAPRRRRSVWIVRIAASVVIALAAGLLWYLTNRQSPHELTVENRTVAPPTRPFVETPPQQAPRRDTALPPVQRQAKSRRGESAAESSTTHVLVDIDSVRTQLTEGRIAGRVLDGQSQRPLAHVSVHIGALRRSATSDIYGHFVVLGVPEGTYSLTLTALGYQPRTVSNVSVVRDSTSRIEADLISALVAAAPSVADARRSPPPAALQQRSMIQPTGAIAGTVVDDGGADPVMGATVLVPGTTKGAVTDTDGKYVISAVPTGTYDLRVSAVGYETKLVTGVRVAAGDTTVVNAVLAMSTVQVQALEITADRPAIVHDYTNSVRIPQFLSDAESRAAALSSGQPRGGRADEAVEIINGVRRPQPQYTRLEGYDRIYENEFLEAATNPLSTFSIDVDAASYTNVRRFVNAGRMPPKDAVRIEELINFFTYDYPQPQGGDPFSITTEVASCPWDGDHRLVLVGLQGKKIATEHLPPSNLVFLLDVSGSMNEPNKLPLVKAAFRLLVDQLRGIDRVSIVVYAGSAGLVLRPTRGDRREVIRAAIDELEAGGSTAGGAGIQLAYKIAKENFIDGGNNRVILATDGDFNVGVSSDGELVRMIEEKRQEGIFLSVLGFGTGNYQDAKMQQLADKGNGNHYYIDSYQEARRVFVGQMSGTLLTIAKDVKIQIEFNPAAVKAYRLIGYENRLLAKEDFNNDRKDAGELGAGHAVTALYEIVPATEQMELPSVDSLKYQRTELTAGAASELMTVKFRYKAPDDSTSRLLTRTLEAGEATEHTASENLRFASAVAEFGMLLRDSKFKKNATYDEVVRLAKGARGDDAGGYRAEFVKLVEAVAGFPKN